MEEAIEKLTIDKCKPYEIEGLAEEFIVLRDHIIE